MMNAYNVHLDILLKTALQFWATCIELGFCVFSWFRFTFLTHHQACGSLSSLDQGSKLGPVQWKQRLLTAEQPGKP